MSTKRRKTKENDYSRSDQLRVMTGVTLLFALCMTLIALMAVVNRLPIGNRYTYTEASDVWILDDSEMAIAAPEAAGSTARPKAAPTEKPEATPSATPTAEPSPTPTESPDSMPTVEPISTLGPASDSGVEFAPAGDASPEADFSDEIESKVDPNDAAGIDIDELSELASEAM